MSKQLALDISEIHDAAHAIWSKAHEYGEADYFDCKLCGATMYPSMDYTHEPDCPYELLGVAIDKFGDAIEALQTKLAGAA